MASLNMLELPGLLALTMTMLVFCVIERDPPGTPSRHILLGVCAVLTYLVKTNYGILIIVSIFSTRWMESDFRARGLLTRANLYVLLPIAAFALIWFAYPAKLASTWMALVNEPWGDEETRGLAGLLFYPRAIADYVGSWWMSILLWAGLAMAWKTRGRPGVRLLAVVATTQFVLGLLHHTKVERHIMPMLPAMFVLFGVGVAEVWARVRSVGSRAPAVAIALGSSLAILYAVALARSDLPTVRPYKTTAIMDYISALARDNAPSVVIGTIGASLQPPDLDWHLVAAEALMPVTAAGYVVDPRQEARRPEALEHAGLFARLRAKAVEVLGIRVPRSELRTFHAAPLGDDDGAQIEPLIERALEQGQPQAIIVTMGIGDAGGQPPGDLVMTLAQRGFTQAEVRDFPGAGTRVALFRRR
jgi:hypothetical protein